MKKRFSPWKYRLVFSWTLTFTLSVLITGCWDYHELDEESIISMFAYDITPSNLLQASAYLQKPIQNSGNSDNGGGKSDKPEILQSTGTSMYEAIKNMSMYSPNQLAFHHHIITILSEKFARSDNFGDGLERITRVGGTRRRGLFAVTSGNAVDVLRLKLPLVDNLAQGLYSLTEASAEQQFSLKVDLNDVLYDLTTTGIEPIVPRIVLKPNKLQRNGKLEVKLFGCGAFRGTHLVGWLSGTETRGVLWLRHKTGHAILRFPWKDGNMIVQTEEIKVKIIPPKRITRINKRLLFQIQTQWKGKIVMYTGHRILSIQDIPSIKKGIDNHIKLILERSIKRAQTLHTDVIGFGNTLYCAYPSLYRQHYLDDWDTVYFPKITYSIQVKAKVHSIGMTNHYPEDGR